MRTAGPAVAIAAAEPTNRPAPITPAMLIMVTCRFFKPELSAVSTSATGRPLPPIAKPMHRHTAGRSPPLGVDHDSRSSGRCASQHPHGVAPALPGEGVDVELAA